EPGRFRFPLELPSLEGFLRFAQVGAERLDFFRLRGKVPIPGFELLPGLGHLPGMARVFRRGLLRRFLLRLLEPLLSLLQGALPFLQGPQVPFHFEDALGRRAGHLPRFRLPRPDLRLGPAEGRLATRELLRLRLDGFGLRVQFRFAFSKFLGFGRPLLEVPDLRLEFSGSFLLRIDCGHGFLGLGLERLLPIRHGLPGGLRLPMLRIQRADGLRQFLLAGLDFLAEVLGSLGHRFELRFRFRQLGVELPLASTPGVLGGARGRLVGFDLLLEFRQLPVPGLEEFSELSDFLRVRLVRLLRLVHEFRAVLLDLSFQLLDRPFPLADLFEGPFGVFLPRGGRKTPNGPSKRSARGNGRSRSWNERSRRTARNSWTRRRRRTRRTRRKSESSENSSRPGTGSWRNSRRRSNPTRRPRAPPRTPGVDASGSSTPS